MPTTRKKLLKTVYKEEDDSGTENGDFSDSGSEAVISQPSSSEDDEETGIQHSSEDERKKKKVQRIKTVKNLKLNKKFATKVRKLGSSIINKVESDPKDEPIFSIKDLTDADKLLPPILNLSESDSSDDDGDDAPNVSLRPVTNAAVQLEDVEIETETEYKDVWSNNLEQSKEIAQRAFLELEQHKIKLEETKQSIQKYTGKIENIKEFDVTNLLALGEEAPKITPKKQKKRKVAKPNNDSDSELEDWEEVAEGKIIPQQGLQLVVDFPDAVGRKSKKLDVEMMMKRKINRVKKEYQVYMHKVHVLCWIGHGNFISQALNNQDILSAALSLIPSKECYPGQRVDMKYVEQITLWFKDKLNIKYDKNEDKFRPKLPPLKNILLQQIKSRIVTSKKYVVYIFVAMLRAVGLQCRIMLNFKTLPIKPPAFELCSLSMKTKLNKNDKEKGGINEIKKSNKNKSGNIPQLDGNYDSLSDSDFDNIVQIDGSDDIPISKCTRTTMKGKSKIENKVNEDVSPSKKPRRNLSINKGDPDISKNIKLAAKNTVEGNITNNKKVPKQNDAVKTTPKKLSLNRNSSATKPIDRGSKSDEKGTKKQFTTSELPLRQTRRSKQEDKLKIKPNEENIKTNILNTPSVVVTNSDNQTKIASEYFETVKSVVIAKNLRARKRSHTSNPNETQNNTNCKVIKKPRAKSVPENILNNSKYFSDNKIENIVKTDTNISNRNKNKTISENDDEECKRVSHKDLLRLKAKPKNDVTNDLVKIIKKRVRAAKMDTSKGKTDKSSDEDSDCLPEITKPKKSSNTKVAKPGTSRKVDRRVLSTDDEARDPKLDIWCEVYVEELEQWITVDVIKGRVHCVKEVYSGATHPVNYVVGWDNNNYLKDLTRKYVPHWNTLTRKQRVESAWWNEAIQPWLGPRTARDKEEDESLDRMQLDAPLPKSIAEYKNHPLYALKRHLLKFEAIYPPDAATLGFVRGEAVYARECVYICRSRDTWLKEAKVVRLGEQPYKVVKARPKWDRLSNKLITDKPLEVFGPWQVQEYEPPVAQNGIVPRNAYGNVELFKECMLPKGTVHVKLPGLNRVAKKLNIDCAPAMTGFDFNGGWSHPVFDGFVVCEEFKDIITSAWHEDQLEQERREIEKLEARVYGNWRRLIKGVLIRERLKLKYGFSDPTTSQEKKKKSTGPSLTLKKKCLDK